MICTFFGHRTAPPHIESKIESLLENLIINYDVKIFYVGNQGSFDRMVYKVLTTLKKTHSHIRYYIVLAYLPQKIREGEIENSDTIYPEGLENVPPKYAIFKRNEWMIQQANIVITYVTHTIGGAARFRELAIQKKKTVIDLYSEEI